MAHLHHVVEEVQGLDFGERSAGTDRLRGEHGDGGPQFELTGHRDSPGREDGGPQDHPGAEPFVLFAGEAAVVVGHGVEIEVLHEPVQADGYFGAPGEVVVVHGVVKDKQLPGQVEAFSDLRVGDPVHPFPEVIEFQHLHVGAEGGGDGGEVGGDVQHARVQVAHEPVPGVAQPGADAGGVHPLGDAVPGGFLLEVSGDGAELDAGPAEDVGDLGDRALAAVGQPFAGVEVGVVHGLGGLQVDHQDRGLGPLGDRQHHRGGQVGGQEDDDEVAVGDAQLLTGRGCFLRIGDEAGVDDVGVEGLEAAGDVADGLLQLRQQRRETGASRRRGRRRPIRCGWAGGGAAGAAAQPGVSGSCEGAFRHGKGTRGAQRATPMGAVQCGGGAGCHRAGCSQPARRLDPGSSDAAAQKSYLSMFSALKTVGGPTITRPPFSTLRSPSSPAVKVSPSAPVILPSVSALPAKAAT